MGARTEARGADWRTRLAVRTQPAMDQQGCNPKFRVGRRLVLLMAPGVVLSAALAACADKPPPAEVTPFAFPAVGAGQKDTAQFGARSGPTVP